MFTDTYHPRYLGELIGNQGTIRELCEWLRDWETVVIKGKKKEVAPPNRFNRSAWASLANPNAKAVLLTGPPGIGKTTAVQLICKQMGFEVNEMNASDCRSRLAIQGSMATLAGNQSLDYFTIQGRAKRQANA